MDTILKEVAMENIKLQLSYDGSRYYGWQKQNGVPAVQNDLEEALAELFRRKVTTHGVGRTDGGAHAFRFTANFKVENFSIPIERLPSILNRILPQSIRILNAEKTDPRFHARISACAREYVYFMLRTENIPAFLCPYSFHDTRDLDLDALKAACSLFFGKHDFQNFCYGYEGVPIDTRRHIYYLRFRDFPGRDYHPLVFYIKCNGFLRGMIRSIIAACLKVGEGKLSLEDLQAALDGPRIYRRIWENPVPACGLFFKRGYYK